ncbi:MAG: hypothetical protein QM710_14415 [Flavobacterium sp.]
MRNSFKFIFVFLAIAMSGCASVTYQKVDSNDEGSGIRYYNSSPYLLVYSNGKGGLVSQIVYLPDPNKKMSASPTSFLASNQLTMEFSKGVYTTGKNTADGTAVSSAIIKAIETAAPALLAALNEPLTEREVPAPYLYKIVVEGSQVSFIGGQGDTTIKVNILKQS